MSDPCPCGAPVEGRRRYCSAACRHREKSRRRFARGVGYRLDGERVRPGRVRRGAPADVRFVAKVHRNPFSGCWLWLGAVNDGGYPLFWHDGRCRRAHRWIYEQRVAPIPAGMTVDHLCNRPGCVNPAHLEVVTLAENVRRQHERRALAALVAA